MSVLVQIKDIQKRYGARTLLQNASASFSKGQKIGVIGRNGAGKSTLCRILTGQEEADSGSIIKNSELRLSYLEQHDPFHPGETVVDFLPRYTGKEEWECAEMTARFQIPEEMLTLAVQTLPGGYQTRVKLAAMLLRDPNFLVLDEPSNYLDLRTLILLETFLQEFKGGYLIVSHDREFLKRTCDHTLEVEHGQLTIYPAPVEDYFEFKEEQLRQKLAYNRTVEKKREQLQEFVDRFRAKASTASRAKSKMKQMEKLESIEIAHATHAVRIRMPAVEPKAGVALECDGLAIGYPEKRVAEGIHLSVDRGARIAILGDNGQGKTTFVRTVAGNLPPCGGSYRWGTGLKVAYYAQHVFQSLHANDTVYAHLQREADEGVTNQQILDMAGCFLFQGDEVQKKVSVLSGGERARLCLAGLLLSKSHVLLLDEPTNHLDFETVEALGEALREFSGTVFFISHDRTFVHLVATQIVEIDNGRILRYPGTYDEYVYHLEMRAHAGSDAGTSAGTGAAAARDKGKKEKHGDAEDSSVSGEDAHKNKKHMKADLMRKRAKLKKIETRLANLAQERDTILKLIAENPFFYSRQRNDQLKVIVDHIEEETAGVRQVEAEIAALQKDLT